MKTDMTRWTKGLNKTGRKLPMPILSFPCISLLGVTVKQLISDPVLQSDGMKLVAERNKAAAAVSMMDLSVEAEAFGAEIRFSDDEVPTVCGAVAADEAAVRALAVPEIGSARTGIYIKAIERAAEIITDRPVLAGIIGPFSLCGRLMDVNEAMIGCYEQPETVHMLLEKCTGFLTEYARAYKSAGAGGVVIAEPLAGILSPGLEKEFSAPYVKQIVGAVKDDGFAVIYHNCGNCTVGQLGSITGIGATAYHFGNSVSMREILGLVSADTVVMGNVDPASQFKNGTPESITAETVRIMSECCDFPNFVLSSGCDIPPQSPWENIDAFFKAADGFYTQNEK